MIKAQGDDPVPDLEPAPEKCDYHDRLAQREAESDWDSKPPVEVQLPHLLATLPHGTPHRRAAEIAKAVQATLLSLSVRGEVLISYKRVHVSPQNRGRG